jgi:cytochrome c oxidase subunit IV
MSVHQSYEEQKRFVVRGLGLLAAITIVEVFVALLAKGHLGMPKWEGLLHVIYMIAMVGASLYKAYFIIFFFMHMAHEVRGMMLSVLMPTLLLVWAIIAFFQEGGSWGARREQIKNKNEEVLPSTPAGKTTGSIYTIPTNSKG